MHEYAPVAITLIAILLGILLNRSDNRSLDSKLEVTRLELRRDLESTRPELKGDISGLRASMAERLITIEADLRAFYLITGELKGRLDAMENADYA